MSRLIGDHFSLIWKGIWYRHPQGAGIGQARGRLQHADPHLNKLRNRAGNVCSLACWTVLSGTVSAGQGSMVTSGTNTRMLVSIVAEYIGLIMILCIGGVNKFTSVSDMSRYWSQTTRHEVSLK